MSDNLPAIIASSGKPIPIDELRSLRHPSMGQGQKQLSLVIPAYQEGQPSQTAQGFANAVKHGWRRNELIYACINKTAKAKAAATLRVRRASDMAVLPDHPFRKLIERPNPHMSEADLWAAVTVYQKLSGHSYWEVVPSRAGLPVELWPLRPDWVAPILTSRGLIGWEYRPPGLPPIRLRPEQVIDLRLFDPTNLFGGTAPVVVAGFAGDIDNAVSTFAKDFFERGALPAGVLKTTATKLFDADIDRIRSQWAARYGGAANWMTAPAVLDSDAEYQRITMSFEEMGFEALDSRNEVRICMVLDVPPIVIGANVGLERATYSNYDQAEESWWRNSIVPDLKHDRDALSRDLLPLFGDDVVLEWDFDDVPALQDEEDAVWKRALAAWQGGGVMLDEYREQIGLDPLPAGKGQVFLVPSKARVVPIERLGQEPAPEPTNPDDNDPDAGEPDASFEGNEPNSGDKGGNSGGNERKSDDVPADAALREAHETRMRDALKMFFSGQLERIEQELRADGVG